MPRKKLKDETDEMFKDLTEPQWEEKIQHRKIHKRYNHVLDAACDCYAEKVPQLRKMILEGVWVKTANPDGSLKSVAEVMALRVDMEEQINIKIERLLDKSAACEKELQKRKDGLVRGGLH